MLETVARAGAGQPVEDLARIMTAEQGKPLFRGSKAKSAMQQASSNGLPKKRAALADAISRHLNVTAASS
jgi:hypothetical protein